MTDHRASKRHRSPFSEASSDHHEGDFDVVAQPVPNVLRRRPVRDRTVSDETSHYPSSPWSDNKGDPRKTKTGRATPRKAPKTALRNAASPEYPPAVQEKHSGSFLPKLSRILEGKESKTIRRRKGSTAGSREDDTAHGQYREDATLTRRSVRQKHGSLQRRVEGLIDLPNPSLVSVLSGFTQLSGVSSDSTSTITQQSYDKSRAVDRKPPKERNSLQTKRTMEDVTKMDDQQANVFRYMDHGLKPEHSRPSTAFSASSASSTDTGSSSDGEDGNSSLADEHSVESPMTSPSSMRKPSYAEPHEDDEDDSDNGDDGNDGDDAHISAQEATPNVAHQPSVSDDVEDNEEDGAEEDEDEDQSSEEEYDDEEAPVTTEKVEHGHQMDLERVPPPAFPSPTSRHSDRHSRRLRRQEQALSDHVLQSPQPHRDFQFVGGPSPHPNHAMPLYSPYMQSDASPASLHATAHAPLPHAPPHPHMVYQSPPHMPPVPYSPGSEGYYAMVTRPPQYQTHPTGPESRNTMIGYELLAGKLSEGSKSTGHGPGEESVIPMYRKFENLNHRVLLHIQDEIGEMEEELRYLDECIAQYAPRDEVGRVQPASRRGETRYGNELHHRRTELLGRIYLKLGQYNSALSSYSTMLKDMSPADTEDILAYRTWMEKRTPIDFTESRFLERKDDLLAFSRRRSASPVGGVPSHQSAAIWLPMILVMPLMAYAIVPGLLGRLFILCSIGAAIMKLLTSTKGVEKLMTAREWAACFSAYFGLMALLAVLAH
ncbi:hypothetical protein P280DRAFT_22690 [Massarina eburnea CBS 473.64]|uniref:DUF6594 domain-containing protein n=1 Tax=Massarina eburnea CBS 473.64 TaxID=1395130 RepID=A0A6A6RXS1_9PLEO|nr:hypothetical protein P280DRAFT_22690 [Massarina eburnea CBS 473.64]